MIGRKATLAFANVLVGALLGLVALKVTAIYFGRESYGEVEFALSVLGILYVLTDLNMGDAHVKRVSEGQDAYDCYVTFATFKIVSSAVFILATLLALYLYAGILDKPLITAPLPVFLVVMGYYLAKSAMLTAQSTFEAKTETARVQLGSITETSVRVALTILGAGLLLAATSGSGPLASYLTPGGPTALWIEANGGAVLATSYALGALVAAVLSITLMYRVMQGRGRFRWDLMKSYWAFALPLFLVSAVGIFSAYVDRAALGFFGSSLDTADLAGPRKLVGVLEGVGAAAGGLLFPTMSALAARGDREGLHRSADSALRYLSLLVLPIVVFLIAFAVPVIRLLLDDEWSGNGLVLSLLALWMLTLTIALPRVRLIMGMNRPDIAARVGIITSLTNVILVLVLVPDDLKSIGVKLLGLKALGAALALLLSGFVYYGLVIYYTRTVFGYRQRVRLWAHVTAGAVMGLVLLAADRWGPLRVARWYSFPIYAVVGMAIYVATLLALKELTRRDLDLARQSLSPGGMMTYIRSELFDREG